MSFVPLVISEYLLALDCHETNLENNKLEKIVLTEAVRYAGGLQTKKDEVCTERLLAYARLLFVLHVLRKKNRLSFLSISARKRTHSQHF